MEIRDLVTLARRNWLLILSMSLVGILLGGLFSLLEKPTYTSETELFVAIQNTGSVQELQQGNTFTQARVQSYVKAATTPVVLQPAIDSLGLEVRPKELAGRVTAGADLNTVLITIRASDSSPVQAAALAQAVGESLIDAVKTLETTSPDETSPVRLSVITPAVAPDSPSAPNTKLSLLLGAVLGLFAGVGASFVRRATDTKIRGEEDLRTVTATPILAGIANDPAASERPLLSQAAPQSPRAESFRQLRTNLQFATLASSNGSILVTSSMPGEGKSTTAINLAIACAQAGSSVCLIDADLRRPMIGDYLGLENAVGLSTALIKAAEVSDLLQPWGNENLYVLTSGRIPPNPSELLGSAEMKELLAELERTFDMVIIDTPPLLPVTDAAVLAQSVQGAVMVVGAQRTKRLELERSLASLEMVGARVLGIVLNRTAIKGPDAYGGGSYGYESRSDGQLSMQQSGTESGHSSREDVTVSQLRSAKDAAGHLMFTETLLGDDQRPPAAFPGRPRNDR
ncbi:polysaccharide biosynthesis tyrosine autokinase [Pseudarthrobacter sp. NPDC058329]|uniref:polysaccharide biosynthesis tyrosine autokinase n=1 Tax=Pseudarthrobacter sp. NPDC058329 TaxID=3346448 RepID=UPI0036DB5981